MRRTDTEYAADGLVMARDYERCLSSMCCHVSNDGYYGHPFLLEEFQRENMWKPLFACGQMEDGRFKRRFRRAIFGLPSGFGKTELAAALVMTVATMEVIHNGQYGVVASSKDQVRNIFEKIATMIKLNSTFKEQWDVGKDIITHRETGAKIMVLPNKADALESWHFNVLIFDELHVYRDSRVWDAGLKGQKVLWNPLTIGITTAGDSREGFLWDTLEKADNDPGLYLYWLGLDDSDDIDKKSSWKKLMCASWVTWESIEDQRGMASSKRAFERYTANRFPRDRDAYSCFTAKQLERCDRGKNDFDFDKPFTLGIDGATAGDSFAIVAYQERKNKNGNAYGYTVEWVFDDPDEETGHYDLAQIMELIAGINQQYWPAVIGIDPNRLIVMDSQLQKTYGVKTVSFAQNNATMCQATSLVMHQVKSGRLKLRGCPKLKEHLGNTVELDREPYGTRFGKDSRKSKIDAAVALSIAVLAYEKLVVGTEGYVPVY
ncbi:MAG: terminase large subunit [Berryella intestinalis]|uniref:terminase large subunit domain-containing protein n=1 Tax=Berryella intestinalis TaxID=1531429 RepID=UPI002A759C22|nr:terminase large subunit [Berryella intestinalis]MDY3129278.1 terminase large subunit [Berryella intestinalis]